MARRQSLARYRVAIKRHAGQGESLDSARWLLIQRLFHEASALDSAGQAAFLEAECGGDEELEQRVRSMLEEDARGAFILDRPLEEVAGHVLLASEPARSTGSLLGRYTIVRKLGEGGMGVVYLAQRDVGGLVAVKVLRDAWVSAERRSRFGNEQRHLATLDHPAIARLYDANTLPDGTPYFVMEYVEGQPLTRYCQEQGASLERRLALFRSVCEAVQYAHGRALIHRDLKPSNILVKEDGTVRLLDFGIAKQLPVASVEAGERTQGMAFMTPAYAAPEQLRGDAVGLYSDIYSLGVVLYELLTDQLPFEEGTRPYGSQAAAPSVLKPSQRVVKSARVRALAASRAAWSDLDVLALSAMHEDPQRRYPGVHALLRDLDHFERHEPLEARPDSLPYRARKFAVRHRRALAATALVFSAALGLVVFFTVRLARARNAALAEVARTHRIEHFMKGLFAGGEENVGPAEDLRVLTLIDRGAREARALDGDPPVQAELFQTLGTIYGDLGRFDAAEPLLQAALHKREALFGPDSPEAAEALVALALMRVEQARFTDATGLVQRALKIDQQHLTPDHPSLARAYYALGHVLVGQGRYADALVPLRESVRSFEKRGDQPLALRFALSEQANAEFYLGHYADSEKLNQRLLALDRSVLGEQHANVADDLINLGAIQQEFGHYAEAERLHRQALPITERWFGPNHPMTASNLTLLARALDHEGKDAEAEELLRRALAIQERSYPAVHPSISSTLNDLGIVARNAKRFDEAESDFKRMLDIEQKLHPNGHERIGVAISNLGTVASERGDYVRAEQLLRQALAEYERRGFKEHLRTGFAQAFLGHALLEQRRFEEAVIQSLAGYQLVNRLASSRASVLPMARADLAAEYAALGNVEQAARFRAEAEQPPAH